ncbi:hypothetical protein SEA_NICHOLASP3_77 [Mycobacterium phage Nicholasp3]|nr:hypothetical protein SEA_NICHOLASP3_77 [Mycobacterium phage Nicholasp3]QDH92581.1 hypothetical protein SEA_WIGGLEWIGGLE_77 [Mycobacterium phage Wigglewiggle]
MVLATVGVLFLAGFAAFFGVIACFIWSVYKELRGPVGGKRRNHR